jgi:hypothetical protein
VDARLTIGGGDPFRTDPLTGRWFRHDVSGGELRVEAPGYEPAVVAQAAYVALEPRAIGVGWVTPSVLRWAREVALPDGAEGPFVLHHPTATSVVVDGPPRLDPAALAPGAWSVELGDGTVLQRALWVDDAGAARIDAWAATGEGVAVTGEGFGAGARAVAFVGERRTVSPVPVRVDGEHDLLLDTAGLPAGERVDVAVWTNGSLLGIDDLWTDRALAWPTDDRDVVDEVRCGCRTGARPSVLPVVLLLSWTRRRRAPAATASGAASAWRARRPAPAPASASASS